VFEILPKLPCLAQGCFQYCILCHGITERRVPSYEPNSLQHDPSSAAQIDVITCTEDMDWGAEILPATSTIRRFVRPIICAAAHDFHAAFHADLVRGWSSRFSLLEVGVLDHMTSEHGNKAPY
jgi:hypothetical protein